MKTTIAATEKERTMKMLNIDKYRDVFIERLKTCRNINDSGGTVACAAQCTKDHADELARRFSPPETDEVALERLFSEYEPPLLQNGDGLKPGDWIMVRDVDSQSFVRRQFLYFFDGKFVCSAPNHAPLEGFAEPWVQARLPEDGE